MITPRTYRPELIPRNGERNAWLLAALALIAWLVMNLLLPDAPLAVLIVAGLLAFSALTISLSNWVDRQTTLTLDAQGLNFANGLRKVSLGWMEIEALQVFSDRLGQRVQVRGASTHFVFRTLGEVHYKGELRGQMGFAQGEEILEQIIASSQLQLQEHENENVRYYSRP